MTTTAQRRTGSTAVARRRPVPVRVTWIAVALIVLALMGAASVAFGVRAVTWPELVGGVSGTSQTIAEAAVQKRVPRTVLAMLVGAALGVAGTVMQGVTRNPLADPGILGVSSGSALAVVVGFAFFGLSSPGTVIWVAIAGAAAAAVLVHAVGSLGRGGATPLKLALAGAAISAAFASMVSAVLLPRIDALTDFRFWQVGGVGGATTERIGQVLPVLAVGAAVCALMSRGLNSLALGDELAAGLGEHVGRTRIVAATGAILLCGAATAVAGPIGFVGLAVPHLCRLLVGVDHRWLLPSAAVTGAALLTGADLVGRLIARPAEVDVGIVTAIVGAPIFIWIVRRQKVRAL